MSDYRCGNCNGYGSGCTCQREIELDRDKERAIRRDVITEVLKIVEDECQKDSKLRPMRRSKAVLWISKRLRFEFDMPARDLSKDVWTRSGAR